jgi:hypothetical protein
VIVCAVSARRGAFGSQGPKAFLFVPNGEHHSRSGNGVPLPFEGERHARAYQIQLSAPCLRFAPAGWLQDEEQTLGVLEQAALFLLWVTWPSTVGHYDKWIAIAAIRLS